MARMGEQGISMNPGSEHGEPQRQPAPLETGMSRHENTLAGICPFQHQRPPEIWLIRRIGTLFGAKLAVPGH